MSSSSRFLQGADSVPHAVPSELPLLLVASGERRAARSMGLHATQDAQAQPLYHRELLGELARLAYQTVHQMMVSAAEQPDARILRDRPPWVVQFRWPHDLLIGGVFRP